MTPEQMQKIVDGAPEWAEWWQTNGTYKSCLYDCDYDASKGERCYMLSNLRDELAKREPMDLRDVDIPHGTIVLEK